MSVSTAVLRDEDGNVIGGAETFRDISELEALRKEIKGKYSLPERFILFVGSVEPRKNISCVLRAMEHIKSQKNIETKLVVAGGSGWRLCTSTTAPRRPPYSAG